MGKHKKYPYDENQLIECRMCKQIKIAKLFYKQLVRTDGCKLYRFRYCKECYGPISKEYREKKRLIDGSPRVLTKPNTYTDETQKRKTFEYMEVLGYLFDTVTGIWWKPGIKEIEEGKPKFLKVTERDVKRRGRRKK